MSAPTFQVAFRDRNGTARLARICDETIQTYEDAMACVLAEIPDVKVVLAAVQPATHSPPRPSGLKNPSRRGGDPPAFLNNPEKGVP